MAKPAQDVRTKAQSIWPGAVVAERGWKFTAPVSGYYHIYANATFSPSTAWAENEQIQLYLYTNNSFICEIARKNGLDTSGASAYNACHGTVIEYLSASQYFDVRVRHDCGVTLAIQGTAGYNYIEITRVG